MNFPSFLALAQQAPRVNGVIESLGGWVAAVAVSLGVATVIFGLIFRGIQAKYGDAYTLTQIVKWYNDPTTITQRETFTKKVLDDSVHRDDGIIRHALDEAVEIANADNGKKLDALIASSTRANELYQEVLRQLAHIGGSVDVLKNALKPPT